MKKSLGITWGRFICSRKHLSCRAGIIGLTLACSSHLPAAILAYDGFATDAAGVGANYVDNAILQSVDEPRTGFTGTWTPLARQYLSTSVNTRSVIGGLSYTGYRAGDSGEAQPFRSLGTPRVGKALYRSLSVSLAGTDRYFLALLVDFNGAPAAGFGLRTGDPDNGPFNKFTYNGTQVTFQSAGTSGNSYTFTPADGTNLLVLEYSNVTANGSLGVNPNSKYYSQWNLYVNPDLSGGTLGSATDSGWGIGFYNNGKYSPPKGFYMDAGNLAAGDYFRVDEVYFTTRAADFIHDPNGPAAALMPAPPVAAKSIDQASSQTQINITKPYYYQPPKTSEPTLIACDVAVYGGTPAGVTAAVQAGRMGKKAVLLSFNNHVGGMTSGGLTATDIGNRATIGGLAIEFYNRLGKIKDFSPAEAEALYLKMLEEVGVEVRFNQALKEVAMDGTRIVSATMYSGETIKAGMFIDSTYEGDLFAAANVSYTVGRESESAYGESLAGQWKNDRWPDVYQFCRLPISPYVEPDKPESGLLPEISGEPFGKRGEGDFRVQAYNFRMFLSNKAGKIPFPKPDGYDPNRYALLARFLNFDPALKWTLDYTVKPMTDGPIQMRNGDSNNAGSFSSDYIGRNFRWPDGTYEVRNFAEAPPPRRGPQMPFDKLYELREKIFQNHVTYQQGFMYFLANDPQVPKGLQERVREWGLDPNEFVGSGHWPHQLYVREGRRMVSTYVMTQLNAQSKRIAEDSVGLASYNMDSHFCQRVVLKENGKDVVRGEGGLGVHVPKPFAISYRSIVPKKEECVNLLVPVCLSASHAAYGSIRMEPVFMILGQSAGAAASLATGEKVAVQDVDYGKLRQRLLSDGQKL